MSPGDYDEDCCDRQCELCLCFPCTLINLICCCRRMTKTRKIQIFWGWLLACAISIGFIFGMVIYGPMSTLVSPSDMRSVAGNMHFLFCDEAEVDSTDMTFTAYLTKLPLVIDDVNRKMYNSDNAIFVDSNAYNYFSFYFLPGSEMTLRHCSESPLTFYLFKGDSSFKTLSNGGSFDFYLSKVYMAGKYSCVGKSSYSTFHFNANEEDHYYMVYSNEYYPGTWLDFSVNLNRTIYNISDALPVCTSASSFSVPLNGPDEAVIIDIEDYYSVMNHLHSNVTIKCVPRIWAYFLILGFGVLFVGVFVSILIQKQCRDVDLVYQGDFRSHGYERQPLLNETQPPSYNSVTISPPKYEDIYRGSVDDDDDENLPTYVQAVGSLEENECRINLNMPFHYVNENSTAAMTSLSRGNDSASRTIQNSRNIQDGFHERQRLITPPDFVEGQSTSVIEPDSLETPVRERGELNDNACFQCRETTGYNKAQNTKQDNSSKDSEALQDNRQWDGPRYETRNRERVPDNMYLRVERSDRSQGPLSRRQRSVSAPDVLS